MSGMPSVAQTLTVFGVRVYIIRLVCLYQSQQIILSDLCEGCSQQALIG